MIPEVIIRLNALLCHFDKTYIWVTLWQISVVCAFSIFFVSGVLFALSLECTR